MQNHSDTNEVSAPDQPGDARSAATVIPDSGVSARLLRQFAVLSVLAAVAILVLAGYGIYRVYNSEVIEAAEATAIQVGESIFEQERATLLRWGGKTTIVALGPDDFYGLDLRMKKFLLTFNMHKIKVFSADKAIVYSTDRDIVGKVEANNPKLDAVLAAGTVVSQLEFKDALRDLKGEDHFRVDVVETYLPIRMDNFIVGAFEVYTDVSAARDRVRQAMIYILGVLAAVLMLVFCALYLPMRTGMVRLKSVEGKLRNLASVDALTGIFNRRHVLELVGAERARILRKGGEKRETRMALLMVDIDFFKKVNDTHGHLVGDEVLRATTLRLKSALRSYDFIGRYGGEEFLVVLPETDMVGAMVVAERMRERVCGQPLRCGDLELQVSVSVGVATNLDADEQILQILNRADAGLYQAKESGRNRVCSVQPAAASA